MPFKASEAPCNIFSEDEKLLLMAFLGKKKIAGSFLCGEKTWNGFIFNVVLSNSCKEQERRNLAINTPIKRNK